MQLGQIRAFLAVRESGSLRAAARRIGISQPAISKAVASLEADLQAALFIRTSRGVHLTEAGRLFSARAGVALAELGRAREELSELSGGTQGSVAVGVGAGSIVLTPGAIARFRAERPQARIRIREGTRDVLLPMVRDGNLDFVIALRVSRGYAGADRRQRSYGYAPRAGPPGGRGGGPAAARRHPERLPRAHVGAFMRADTPLSTTAQRMLQAITMAARSLRSKGPVRG